MTCDRLQRGEEVEKESFRPCKICRAANRFDVDKALEDSRTVAWISQRFRYSRELVNTHKAHVPVKSVPTDRSGDSQVSEIARLRAEAQRILDTADDDKVRLAALAQLKGLAELEVRIGQDAQATASLTTHPAWELVRTHLLNILGDCMRCRDAVLGAMPPGSSSTPPPGDTRSESEGGGGPVSPLPPPGNSTD